MRIRYSTIAAGVVCAALAAGVGSMGSRNAQAGLSFGPAAAEAQNFGERSVTGSVLDQNSALVQGATVFLRDLKSKSIRSYTTAANGHFRFAQVSMTEDHEIWAEKDGKKSAVKNISSWDTRKDFVTDLKLK